MSYQHPIFQNKHQKHPKVDFDQYLYNSGEPGDRVSSNNPAELEAELLENKGFMRRRIRRIAHRMRDF